MFFPKPNPPLLIPIQDMNMHATQQDQDIRSKNTIIRCVLSWPETNSVATTHKNSAMGTSHEIGRASNCDGKEILTRPMILPLYPLPRTALEKNSAYFVVSYRGFLEFREIKPWERVSKRGLNNPPAVPQHRTHVPPHVPYTHKRPPLDIYPCSFLAVSQTGVYAEETNADKPRQQPVSCLLSLTAAGQTQAALLSAS